MPEKGEQKTIINVSSHLLIFENLLYYLPVLLSHLTFLPYANSFEAKFIWISNLSCLDARIMCSFLEKL